MNLSDAEYGDAIADHYDDWYDQTLDSDATVRYLNQLQPHGRVLELGVGTGRLALRLAKAGREVTGVDVSAKMLERLRVKDPGHSVQTVHTDMRNIRDLGTFSLVYIAFNTLFGLRTAQDQVELFATVARQLTPEGLFVVEAHIPSAKGLASGRLVSLVRMGLNCATLELMTVDEVNQLIHTQLVEMGPSGNTFYPAMLHYAYPSEMELMAKIAGLEVQARLENWAGTPAGADAHPLITIYRAGTPLDADDDARALST